MRGVIATELGLTAKALTRDATQRIAANIAKPPKSRGRPI
jgi:hypothetical protein